MPDIIIIKTWSCSGCGYVQDFEPTLQNAHKHFNLDRQTRVTKLKANQCPSCKLKGVEGTLAVETDPTKKIQVAIMTPQEVDNLNPDFYSTNDKLALKADITKKLTELEKHKD